MQRQGRRRRDRQQGGEDASGGGLPRLRRMDWLVLGLFVFSLILWGITQCGGGENSEETAALEDSTAAAAPVEPQSASPNPPVEASSGIRTVYLERSLFVIIDSLSMRRGPHLDSARIEYLRDGQELYDMGEVTPFSQAIRISADEIRTEPWVKVKTKKGKVGWVFGAGLHFYKRPPQGQPQAQNNEQ